MIKRYITILAILGMVFTASFCLAQERMAVKLNKHVAADNWIGKRLVVYLEKGIAASPVLKPAGEDSVMLICDLLIAKVEGRPSCAYSIVVTGNAYGKTTPVLIHRLGLFGKNAVLQASQGIIKNLEDQAQTFREKAEKNRE